MKIFVINGQGGSGKTTFEDYVANVGGENFEVGFISMVSYVKQVATGFGWDGSKEPKDRKMLSQLKDLLTEWNDSPFATTCMVVKQMEKEGIDVCFIDAREPDDIERLKEMFNCQTVLVIKGEKTEYGNHADDEVFNYNYDIVIDNNGTLSDLRDAASTFYENFCLDESEN